MRLDLLNNRFQDAGTKGCSEPFALDGTNTVLVQLTCLVGTLDTASIFSSDDMENWRSELSLSVPGSGPAFAASTLVGVEGPYCRLVIKATTASIVNAVLNTTTL